MGTQYVVGQAFYRKREWIDKRQVRPVGAYSILDKKRTEVRQVLNFGN